MARTTTNGHLHIITDEQPRLKLEDDGARLVVDSDDGHGHFALTLTGGKDQRREFAKSLRQAADMIDKWAALR